MEVTLYRFTESYLFPWTTYVLQGSYLVDFSIFQAGLNAFPYPN